MRHHFVTLALVFLLASCTESDQEQPAVLIDLERQCSALAPDEALASIRETLSEEQADGRTSANSLVLEPYRPGWVFVSDDRDGGPTIVFRYSDGILCYHADPAKLPALR